MVLEFECEPWRIFRGSKSAGYMSTVCASCRMLDLKRNGLIIDGLRGKEDQQVKL
jgi:hypothetical protein